MRNLVLFTLISSFFAISIIVTSACGGFFCTNVPIDQSAERIIFTVNGDGTVTAIVGIEYQGEAEDFSWILPLPSAPELDVAETGSLDILQRITEPQFITPRSYCNGLMAAHGLGGGGGSLLVEEDSIGPYNYAILGSDDSQELINWLRENGYQVEPEMEPLIEVYVEEGMVFVAMKLAQDSDVGDIQPIVLTYETENPSIPIRLTAVAAVDNMPILVWVFAETQYRPGNFANPSPDFSDARASHRVHTIGGFSLSMDSIFDEELNIVTSPALRQYLREAKRFQAEFEGKAFITDFAGASVELIERGFTGEIEGDNLLNRLVEDFPYVTRLRAQMSPEEMTLDPIFVPTSDKPDLLSFDLNEHVDPLLYWGCSSRTAIDENNFTNLPEGRTRIEEHHVTIAHPNDWFLTQIIVDLSSSTHDVFVFAPETVTADDVRQALLGNASTPMLVMSRLFYGFYSLYASDSFYIVFDIEDEDGATRLAHQEVWSYVLPPYIDERDAGGLGFVLLAPPEDWQANQARFDAMLRFVRNYEYYLHPDLRHTLMLSSPRTAMIAYPDGWIERVNEEGVIVIEPEDDTIQAEMRLLYDQDGPSSMIDDVVATYRIDPEQAEALTPDLFRLCEDFPILTFENGNESGIIAFNHHFALVVSAVNDAINLDLMMAIGESFFSPNYQPFTQFECEGRSNAPPTGAAG